MDPEATTDLCYRYTRGPEGQAEEGGEPRPVPRGGVLVPRTRIPMGDVSGSTVSTAGLNE